MGLLRADLQALGNVVLRRQGRRALLAHGISLAVLAAISALMGQAMLLRPELQAALHGDLAAGRAGLLEAALAPAVLVAIWFAFGQGWRALFETAELPLWLQSPLGARRPAAQVLLRVTFLAWLWGTALCGPFAAEAMARTGGGGWTVAAVPAAVLVCLLPPIALVMSAQITAQRFLHGPAAQGLATVLAALASLLFAAFLTAGAFAPADLRADQFAAVVRERPALLSAATGAAADLLVGAGGGPFAPGALAAALAWVAGALLVFFAVAGWHPRAADNSARVRRRRALRRGAGSWPDRPAAAVRRKELVQVLQQPGQLLGQVLFAVLIWVLASNGVLVRPILETAALPLAARHGGAMLGLWFLATLMALNAHMGRMALQDGGQWPLYLAAPVAPGAILRGKLRAVWLLLLWPTLVVALVGSQVLGAAPTTVAVAVAAALLGNGIALGVVAGVGTLPALLQPDETGRIGQGTRPLLLALLLVLAFELAVAPAVVGAVVLAELLQRGEIGLQAATGILLAGMAALGLLVGGLGVLLGTRNYRRLLRAR